MIQMPEICTIAELAAYLKVSKKTIYNWKSARYFMDGIFLLTGGVNMEKVKYCIAKYGTYLKTRQNDVKFN